MDSQYVQFAISAYASLVGLAMPVVFLIGACNIAFNMIYSAFSRGKFRFGGQ